MSTAQPTQNSLSRLAALKKRNSKIAAGASTAKREVAVKDEIADMAAAQRYEQLKFDASLHVLGNHLGFDDQDFSICRSQWRSDELLSSAMAWMDQMIDEEGLMAARDDYIQLLREEDAEYDKKSPNYVARRLKGVLRCNDDDQWIVDQVSKLPSRERSAVLANYSLIYGKIPEGNRKEANLFLCDMVEKKIQAAQDAPSVPVIPQVVSPQAQPQAEESQVESIKVSVELHQPRQIAAKIRKLWI